MAILKVNKAKLKKVIIKESPYKPHVINFDLPGLQQNPAPKNQEIKFDFDKFYRKFNKLRK